MRLDKKAVFYEVNPRYFYDHSGDGIGDLEGLALKFDYFKYLNVDAIMLQDILSTDISNDVQNFTELSPEIGTLDDLKKVIAKANKFGIKVLMELKIGYITKNNVWFNKIESQKNQEFKDVVEFVPVEKQLDNGLEYVKSEVNDSYYVFDAKTQEVPLNWKSDYMVDQFISVIKFWREIGISGFVFKDFEYVADKEKTTVMSNETITELWRFTKAIKDFDIDTIIVGKSSIVDHKKIIEYTKSDRPIFDYFISTQVSLNGTHLHWGTDKIGKFSPMKLGNAIRTLGNDNSGIISFGSKLSGRILSRWGNENAYITESAKGLALLLLLSKSSSSIYYGDELGIPNIGLGKFDDFQDRFIDQRLEVALANNISKEKFLEAQIFQNPINSKSLMPWNDDLNGGFSKSEKTITPAIKSFKSINVTKQFEDKESVFNFYKLVIEKSKDGQYANIINKGKFKVFTLVHGVVMISYKMGPHSLKIIVNLSDKVRPTLLAERHGRVILSTYTNKEYNSLPKTLDAYEGIVVTNFIEAQIKEDVSISLKEVKIELDEDMEKETFVSPVAPTSEGVFMGFFKRKSKQVKQQTAEMKVKEELTLDMEVPLKSTLEIEKDKALAEREADRSHKDEQTKLTEDQLAKTTLIDDNIDLEELFKHEIEKKKKD